MKLKKTLTVIMTIGVLLFFPVFSVQAQGITPETPKWWEVATGVISIPVALIGIAYSYALIRKTRLEIRKTELEIIEKEQKLKKLSPKDKEAYEEIAKPVITNQKIQYLIPRFIILYLILQSWDLIKLAMEYGLEKVLLVIYLILNLDLNNIWLALPYIVLVNLPKLAYWITLISIGWSLFKDANSIVGLNLKDIFFINLRKKQS